MATANDVMQPTWEAIDGTDYLVKPLESIEMLEVSESLSINDRNEVIFTAALCRKLLTYGLKGWRNFFDSSNEEVFFTRNQEENINRIPVGSIRPLAMLIFSKCRVGAEDEKNLS